MELGEQFGYRNAQATVLAPTGTIGFMMDCDTTGVEPDIALVKYKKLVGGGLMKIVNTTVPMALKKLGYNDEQVAEIVAYIDEHETIEGAPYLKDQHLAVFDCAFKAAKGQRSIHYMGHIKMMGATQPFISGAISKTVNVPKEATVDEIMQAYIESWKLGRQGDLDLPRRQQAHAAAEHVEGQDGRRRQAVAEAAVAAMPRPVRRRLPDERQSITHKFDIAGHEGYITVGLFEDGQPGEIFLVMAKEGSTISGFADAFAQAISYALQYGVPLQVLVDKFSHARFEPSGMTQQPRGPLRQVDRRLHLPVDGDEVPVEGGAVQRRREHGRAARSSRQPSPSRRSPQRRRDAETPKRRRLPARRSRTRKTRRRARPAGRS